MASITKNAPLLTALLAFSLAQCGKVVTHRYVGRLPSTTQSPHARLL
jgi:hypothetical protein